MSAARSRTGATGDDRREPALDLGDLARTDALVEAIAGRTPPAGDDLAAALVDWLDGIDQEFQALVAPAPLTVRPLEDAPSRRRRKAALLTAAAVFAVAAGTGVAAASPGSLLYPVHRSLFGAVDEVFETLSMIPAVGRHEPVSA